VVVMAVEETAAAMVVATAASHRPKTL